MRFRSGVEAFPSLDGKTQAEPTAVGRMGRSMMQERYVDTIEFQANRARKISIRKPASKAFVCPQTFELLYNIIAAQV